MRFRALSSELWLWLVTLCAAGRLDEPVAAGALDRAAADLWREGFVLLPGLLDPDEIAELRPTLQGVADAHADEWNEKVVGVSAADARRRTKQFTRVYDVRTKAGAAGARLALSRRLGSAAAELLGVACVRFYQDQLFFKRGGDAETMWHQDSLAAPLDTNELVTLWAPLHDVTDAHGALRFARGSHRDMTYNFWNDGNQAAEAKHPFYVYNSTFVERRFELATLGRVGAGDVSAHLGWTVHGARGNAVAGEDREVFAVSFVPDGTRALPYGPLGLKHTIDDKLTWVGNINAGEVLGGDAFPLAFCRDDDGDGGTAASAARRAVDSEGEGDERPLNAAGRSSDENSIIGAFKQRLGFGDPGARRKQQEEQEEDDDDNATDVMAAELVAGWNTPRTLAAWPQLADLSAESCGLERVTTPLSPADFERDYRHRKAFILDAAANADGTTRAHAHAWSRARVVAASAETMVTRGTPDTYHVMGDDATRVPLSEFVEAAFDPRAADGGRREQCANGSDFVFERAWPPSLALPVAVPAFARGDADLGAPNVLSLGGNASGFPFHLHGEAWLELLAGRKLWSVFDLEAVGSPPLGFDSAAPHARWLERALAEGAGDGATAYGACVQRPGDVVYVPSGWFHATASVGAAVAVGAQRRADESTRGATHARLIGLQRELQELVDGVAPDGAPPRRRERRPRSAATIARALRELERERPRLLGAKLSEARAWLLSGAAEPGSRKAALEAAESAARHNDRDFDALMLAASYAQNEQRDADAARWLEAALATARGEKAFQPASQLCGLAVKRAGSPPQEAIIPARDAHLCLRAAELLSAPGVEAKAAGAGPILRELALRSAPELARVNQWSQAERRYGVPIHT